MTAVYRCIEEGKVGIFESPTGQSCLPIQVVHYACSDEIIKAPSVSHCWPIPVFAIQEGLIEFTTGQIAQSHL